MTGPLSCVRTASSVVVSFVSSSVASCDYGFSLSFSVSMPDRVLRLDRLVVYSSLVPMFVANFSDVFCGVDFVFSFVVLRRPFLSVYRES